MSGARDALSAEKVSEAPSAEKVSEAEDGTLSNLFSPVSADNLRRELEDLQDKLTVSQANSEMFRQLAESRADRVATLQGELQAPIIFVYVF